MDKNIWIINEHLTSPDLSENGHSRHYTLSKEFQKKGYDISLITSSFSHNPKREVRLRGLMRILKGNVRTLVIKGFAHQKSNSPIRILNWFLFFLLLFFAPLTKLPKPNIIILSSTPMLPVYNVLFFKLLFPNCKFIFETRDLWPLTPKSIGNYSDKSIFIKFLTLLERKCYTKADYIVSVLRNSDEHIKGILGNQDFKFKWISNGIDSEDFAKNQKEKDWCVFEKNLPRDSFIIGYAGTLGKANAMEYIVESFNRYFKDSKYYLVILGDGGLKEELQALAKGNKNILFLDPVNRIYLMSFYRRCDVLYLSWKNIDLYKYGVSANKIFEYMYSKTPILMSCNIPGNIIVESNCGLVSKPEDSWDIKDKILAFEKLTVKERKMLGKNGHTFLMNHLTYEKLGEKYVDIFDQLIGRVSS